MRTMLSKAGVAHRRERYDFPTELQAPYAFIGNQSARRRARGSLPANTAATRSNSRSARAARSEPAGSSD
ncbi:MAG: hypothetical protein LBI62_06385 [Candidatus Accumulibacter sp.]|nr:hypothetical protein [Accumulibacter sp.]